MTKNLKFILKAMLAGLMLVLPVLAQAQMLTALEIMEILEDNRRATTNSALTRMQLSSCKSTQLTQKVHSCSTKEPPG